MALNIKDEDTDRLVRALASTTGESITAAVATAVQERLDRIRGARRSDDLAEDLEAIAKRVAALPVLDDRSSEEIIGYDEHGAPA